MNIVPTFAIFFILWFPFGAHIQGHIIHKRVLNGSISSNKDYIILKNETDNLNPKVLHKSVNENDFSNVTTKQNEKMSEGPHTIKELQIANHEFIKNASKIESTLFIKPQNQTIRLSVEVMPGNDNELRVENQIPDFANFTFETPGNVSSNTRNTSQMVISTMATTNRTDLSDHNTTNLLYSKLTYENETSKLESESISEITDIEPEMDVVIGFFETIEPKIMNSSLKVPTTEFESLPMILSIFATANKSGLVFGGLQMEEELINQIKAELPGPSDWLNQNQSLINNVESDKGNEVVLSTFKPLEASSTRNNLSILEEIGSTSVPQ